MSDSTAETIESLGQIALVMAAIWLVATFVLQMIAAARGAKSASLWAPQFIRVAAISLVGLVVSAKAVHATATPQQTSPEPDDRESSLSLSDAALFGSVTTNVALGSYLLAKKRIELRKMTYGSASIDDSRSGQHAEQRDTCRSHHLSDNGNWQIIVRVLGPPSAEDRDGRRVTFSKGKALELLVWMAEHRGSSLRSAARTALWDGDVRDATFANVVSEVRRGLNSAVGEPPDDEWLPRTFSDRLPLHEAVVTDAQLLAIELDGFESGNDQRSHAGLVSSLNRVTNLPFSGVNYAWADAEGITTSHVILIVRAAVHLAELAIGNGDTTLLFSATERGLRVLPGHEELVLLRMKGHAHLGNRAAIRLEWESYSRAVESDAWAGGAPSEALRVAAEELSRT
jgi:hypothetical protein